MAESAKQTYDLESPGADQLTEALRVLEQAKRDIQKAMNGLQELSSAPDSNGPATGYSLHRRA